MAALCSVTHGLIVGNIGRYSQVNSLSELAIFTPLMTKPSKSSVAPARGKQTAPRPHHRAGQRPTYASAVSSPRPPLMGLGAEARLIT